MSRWSGPLARAYGACESLARSHYENFPVASRLLPAPMRPHIAAVYAFARIADDMADEGDASASARQAWLKRWGAHLHESVAAGDRPPAGDTQHALVIAATAHTIRLLDLPIALFDDLLSAFSQDTATTRYASWRDLFDYCRRSANPVGRLVLRIAGYRDPALDRASDALCTALQLTNFWQDLGRDWRAGRLYVPREVLDACGAREGDFASPAWSRALDACVAVTREQFALGRPVCDGVRGRLRFELRCTWLGGTRILDRVAARTRPPVDAGESLIARPTLRAADAPSLLWHAIRWRTPQPSAAGSAVPS